jgi:hypothetical protein
MLLPTALPLLVGCHSGSDPTSERDAGCVLDASSCTVVDAGAECALDMPLTGGVNGTARAQNGDCGQAGTSLLIAADIAAVSFHFNRSTHCSIDERSFVSMTIASRVMGSLVAWETPPGACAVTIDSSACHYTPAATRVLAGRGRCTMPAQPASGNPHPPISVGDFTFTVSEALETVD